VCFVGGGLWGEGFVVFFLCMVWVGVVVGGGVGGGGGGMLERVGEGGGGGGVGLVVLCVLI